MLVNLAILLCESAIIVNWRSVVRWKVNDAKLHRRDRKYCHMCKARYWSVHRLWWGEIAVCHAK